MKINPINDQTSFNGLRINKNSVIQVCELGGEQVQQRLNKTVAGFNPRPVSIWSSSGYVGMFFKSKEHEKAFQYILNELKIDYQQSEKIDSFDGWIKQKWIDTGNLPD